MRDEGQFSGAWYGWWQESGIDWQVRIKQTDASVAIQLKDYADRTTTATILP